MRKIATKALAMVALFAPLFQTSRLIERELSR